MRAKQLFARAVAQTEEGLLDAAAATYRELLAIAPDDGAAWFNLGLLAKRQRAWAEARECNLRAAELDPRNEPAWWNLGTAATALRDWPTARRAWRGFGIELPEGDGPISLPCGTTPVRLNPRGHSEVVWCERIDPVRAIIRNVPLPESEHRWGDVVLHDGEPRGERVYGGKSYPVFDELERWQASDVPTLGVEVRASQAADVAALSARFGEYEVAVEDWTGTVRLLCQACSEGRPHDHVQKAAWADARRLGVACDLARALPILERWKRAGAGREVGDVVVVA
jgi:hypothetical protein